jgi:ABC-type uncharacterized transport system permease subunit
MKGRLLSFSTDGNKIVVIKDAKTVVFKEFTAILDTYTLDKATKLLLFVFFMEELTRENPLRDVPQNEQYRQALHRAFNKEDYTFSPEELTHVEAARKAYVTYSQTAEERLLRNLDHKIDEINLLLATTKYEITAVTDKDDNVTNYISNSDLITKTVNSVKSIRDTKTMLENSIMENEQGGKRKIRGQKEGTELSLLETGTVK